MNRGGMGTVYRALQISMSRDVAVKLLSPDQISNKDFIKHFYRAAHAAARLSHPHIVSAIDVGEDNGYHYFAMEWVNGKSLKDLMDEQDNKPLSEERA